MYDEHLDKELSDKALEKVLGGSSYLSNNRNEIGRDVLNLFLSCKDIFNSPEESYDFASWILSSYTYNEFFEKCTENKIISNGYFSEKEELNKVFKMLIDFKNNENNKTVKDFFNFYNKNNKTEIDK